MSGTTSRIVDHLQETAAWQRRELLMAFLRERTASCLSLDVCDVEPGGPLMALGLTPLQARQLEAELESQLGVPLRRALPSEYPTLEALAAFLSQRLGLGPERGPAPRLAGMAPQERSSGVLEDVVAAALEELCRN